MNDNSTLHNFSVVALCYPLPKGVCPPVRPFVCPSVPHFCPEHISKSI
jgi:hypothetical protein